MLRRGKGIARQALIIGLVTGVSSNTGHTRNSVIIRI